MNTIKTAIEGLVIIEPKVFSDERGYFFESFSQQKFVEEVCNTTFVQDNESKSSYRVTNSKTQARARLPAYRYPSARYHSPVRRRPSSREMVGL